MLLVVMLVGIVAALFVFGIVDTTAIELRRNQDTAAAFANVKQALIGWSVQRTSSGALPNARPGELPCPDMNNDGFEDGNCAAGALGRVPWKTLGIPEPKDGAGETLWYAIAGPFRIWGVNANPINSDTKGNLTVYRDSTASTITTEAIAVVFAPGVSFGAQNRDTTATALCPTTGTNIALNLCAANYLETAATVNNSTINGPFISAPSSDTFNDRVMAITTADLMPLVEIRVAREMLALLDLYKSAAGNTCGCYTWGDNDFNNEGDNDVFRGWLPLGEGDPHIWGPPPADPGPPINLGIAIPAWLSNNDWWKVIYYAVAPDESQNKSGGTLTLDGVPGTNVILITPGPAPQGVPRPLNAPGTAAYWAEYLKDAENADHNDNTYVRPSSTAYARNRLYTRP
ncbi:MAG TPA: hypothetical protein VGA12_10490 [Burkholderiales bacterium]|jgi:hypothetical protein